MIDGSLTEIASGADVRTGGCLCGAVRYEAAGEPMFQGYCFCADCRKASGSGFVPFMGYRASALRFSGRVSQFKSKAANGGEATRNRCAVCGSLVFGGIVGEDDEHTIYAGTLDDPSRFAPTIAIFTRDRPPWVVIPADVKIFATMPGGP